MDSKRSSRHSRVLKKLRPSLIKELPEPANLLDNPELRKKFSLYERSHIMAPSCQSQRAEKFLEVMEFAPQEVFELFMAVLKTMSPDLATRLKDTWENMDDFSGAHSLQSSARANASSCAMDMQRNGSWMEGEKLVAPAEEMGSGIDRQPQAIEEDDAGPFGLTRSTLGHGRQHLSCLSYAIREYLSTRLNGSRPDRNIFHSFCHAMEVEERLSQAAARSVNPTAYLIQELSEQQDGTMERLERALALLGMRDVYEYVLQML